MSDCDHIASIPVKDGVLGAPASSNGCAECLAIGSSWLHLRRCLHCGSVGCCNDSPNKHATRHARESGHALIQSFEPGEDWVWCFVDEVTVDVAGATDSPSYATGDSQG